MDAKAKVVAWMVTVPKTRRNAPEPEVFLYYKEELPKAHAEHGDAVVPLIPLTDHEAALAEMRTKCDAWQRLAEDWRQATERREEENQSLLTQHNVLLAGLEALAGEWMAGLGSRRDCERDTVAGHDATVSCADALVSFIAKATLTNSATDEKSTDNG